MRRRESLTYKEEAPVMSVLLAPREFYHTRLLRLTVPRPCFKAPGLCALHNPGPGVCVLSLWIGSFEKIHLSLMPGKKLSPFLIGLLPFLLITVFSSLMLGELPKGHTWREQKRNADYSMLSFHGGYHLANFSASGKCVFFVSFLSFG